MLFLVGWSCSRPPVDMRRPIFGLGSAHASCAALLWAAA